jgi:hypothetical protein
MPKIKEYKQNADEDCKKMVKAYIKVADILEKAASKTKDSVLKQAISYLLQEVIPEEIEFWAEDDELEKYSDSE